MKCILKAFGLIRLKDLNKHLDEEIKYWENARRSLTDPNDVLRENYTNQYSNYAQCLRDLKSDILCGNIK